MSRSIRSLHRVLGVSFVSLWLLSLPAAAVETHRLRVANRVDGAVEVSLDRGLSYQRIGRVTRPATQNADGPARAGAVPAGSVALVGAGRVWVRAGAEGARPRIFGLHARDGPTLPWAIATDLPPGSAAFAALAPPLGSRVFLQAAGRSEAARGLRDLPAGYVPTRDDVLVFVADLRGGSRADDSRELPRVIQWENRAGGRVTAIGGDGGERRIATVRAPVRGVGRYDATATVLPGRVAEHHAEGFLISTAGPVGDAAPAVGGFRIQMAGAADQEDPTLLALDPAGEPMPFVLPLPLDATTRVEMRVDGGPWMPLPRLTGAIPDAWGSGLARLGVLGLPSDAGGVTEFRLLAGGDPAARRAALAQAVQQARARVGDGSVVIRERVGVEPTVRERAPSTRAPGAAGATPPAAQGGGPVPLKGRLTVRANVTGEGISVVVFRLDGRVAKITNVPPFVWEWDTREVANGDHTLEILGKDDAGNLINRRVTRVRVEN